MTLKRLAYLTMDDMSGWVIDTELVFPPLQALGWQANPVPWRSVNPDWNQFDAVYIGTPWDYQEDPDLFLGVLESISQSGTVLLNDISLVRWSIEKSYLRDLEGDGIAIVPSLWYERMTPGIVDNAFDALGTHQIIVKPTISASAANTYCLTRESATVQRAELENIFSDRAFLAQPFVESIQNDGEYSLFYFNGRFSHAVQKIPGDGDFRVQEEFGASIVAVTPVAALSIAAEMVLEKIELIPVYARIDFVRNVDNDVLLMELELIEPSMYLRTNPNAPGRFAEAIDQYVSATAMRNNQ